MWTSCLENPEAIVSIFREESRLSSVRLMKIELLEDGPAINVGLALRDYPRNPPHRWSRIRANAVVMVLQLMGASRVSIDGWATDNTVDCLIEKTDGNSCELKMIGPEFRAHMAGFALRIARLDGYQ
jgi:hypothetical protein